MGNIISTEKPKYLENQIEIFSKNKVGQYSKFLDKTPIFVTYYSINQPMSRQDIGTGNIESEIGPKSPIKFNKIINFPIYNVPELKPDVVYDESGYDVELDCSDLVALPNTIKPKAGDYFLITLPGTKEFLFRVNNFRYNTIQSNDFYLFDADIKYIGDGLEDKYLSTQIVEEYLTIFDNIGTEDRCFVRTTDIDYINNLSRLSSKLLELYKSIYYKNEVNAFTYRTGVMTEAGCPIYRYDPYLEYFINKSNIFYQENEEVTLVLSPAAIIEDNFKYIFDQTLYSAVLERTVESLKKYCYGINMINTKRFSPFHMMGLVSETVKIFCKNTAPQEIVEEEPWKTLVYYPDNVDVSQLSETNEYFSSSFLISIINGTLETDSYFELIIFNYINRIAFKIDRKLIFGELDELKQKHFCLIPMIVYIINTMYNDYFVTVNDLEYLK